MKQLIACFAAVFIFAMPARADVPEDIIAASVQVNDVGSGVIYRNKTVSFVWTDAHVIDDSQSVTKKACPKTGRPITVVTYKDHWCHQDLVEDGRKVGRISVLAKVVRYSESHDIALLRVYKANFGKSAKFAAAIPKQGTGVWNVGCARGNAGTMSLSDGVVSAVGRLRRDGVSTDTDSPFIYDQFTCAVAHGNSGGGIFRKDNGECLGLFTEWMAGNPLTFGCTMMTPTRRIREFAKTYKCEWAVDDSVPIPETDREPITCDPLESPEPACAIPECGTPNAPPRPFIIPLPQPPGSSRSSGDNR